MAGRKTSTRNTSRQKIPRISGRQADNLLDKCDQLLLRNSEVLANLPRIGFRVLLSILGDDILQLALQPDSWGKRLRARLMSDIAPALQGDMSGRHGVNADDIAHCANIVMPCLLLELGRRNQHIEIEFPPDPTDSSARFKLSTGKSNPRHSINNEQLVRLASSIGDTLVSLCYFGDQHSRDALEAELKAQPVA
jgi:hypothetical protein